MSNQEPAMWTQLSAIIASSLPSITEKPRRISQINRKNWTELIGGGELTPPFIVLDILKRQKTDEWGMQNNTWYYPLEAYIVITAVGDNNVVATSGALAVAFRDALMASSTGFQVLSEPEIDTSDVNPANMEIYICGAQLFAVGISAQLLVGETFA